jgi:purine-nucleoside phosphorylase
MSNLENNYKYKNKVDININKQFNPEYMILGSGLGSFTEDINVEFISPYNDIPNFPVSTVQGHKGALVFGTIGDKRWWPCKAVFILRRVFHEGSDFPVRVMKYLVLS